MSSNTALSPRDKRFKKIYIEIGNICNLQCSFCPAVEREKLRLDAVNLRKILREVEPLANRICYHLMGEPLAHPSFPEFVDIANSMNAPLEITTNGTLLSEKNVQALLNTTVQQVNFSLQSFPDNFPDANIEVYYRKIFTFIHQALNIRPDLYINLRLWNLETIDDRSKNGSTLERIEREFQVKVNPKVDVALQKSKKIIGKLYLHFDSRFTWPNMKETKTRKEGTCYGGRTQIAIHADGTVVPCCLDKEANIPLGNILETPIDEILQGTRYRELVAGFERGQLLEPLCQRCGYATRFKRVK